jgi:hypothetical protein
VDRWAKWDPISRRSASEQRPPEQARALYDANWRKSRIAQETIAQGSASPRWNRPKSIWPPLRKKLKNK